MSWTYGDTLYFNTSATPPPYVMETRYLRSDKETINGLQAYKARTARSVTQEHLVHSEYIEEEPLCTWAWDIVKRDDGGYETVLGSKIAQVTRTETGEGLQSDTWNPGEIPLAETDSIVFRVYAKLYEDDDWFLLQEDSVWTTEQLNAIQLDAVTWTLYLYTEAFISGDPPYCYILMSVYFGMSDYDSKIEGFSYSVVPPEPFLTVTTKAATMVTHGAATLNGNLSQYGYLVTKLGFDWRKQGEEDWTEWDETEPGGWGNGDFGHRVYGLEANTTYEFKAKAYATELEP